MSSEKIPPCPCCMSELKYRDSRKRIMKGAGGEKKWLLLRRFHCDRCNTYHNELPDILLPYKHYASKIICGVIDGEITPDDIEYEDYPCMETMMLWIRWFRMNLEAMEGHLRNVNYQLCGHMESLLSSDRSLLMKVRNSFTDWLQKAVRIIYNSGGFLPALPL